MKHDIEDFAPTPDGKYSPLFYKHLKAIAKRYGAKCIRVFQTGSLGDRNVHSPYLILNDIIIAVYGDHDDGVGGRQLASIVRGDRGRHAMLFFYPKGFNLLDITDKFFDDYKRIGRCVWDINHKLYMMDDEGRFTERGKTRTCNWCGAKHRKHVEIVYMENVTWKPVKTMGA